MQPFRANALIKLVEKFAKATHLSANLGENIDTHAKTRVMQWAATIQGKDFVKITDLPPKCFKLLANFEQVSSPSRLIK